MLLFVELSEREFGLRHQFAVPHKMDASLAVEMDLVEIID
jgi:hypothetical protein